MVCDKCDGSGTLMVNYGDGGGHGIVKCKCALEFEALLRTFTPEQLRELSEALKQ